MANDDFVLTDRNSVVVIDVLANDSDPDGDPLSVVELLDLPGPDVGNFTVTEDNRVRFEPTNWSGAPLQIRYRISDGRGGFAEAIVDIKC